MVVGFTVLEVVVVAVIVSFVIGGLVITLIQWNTQLSTVAGGWSTHPATVSQAPASGTFVWTVTDKVSGAPVPMPNRATSISVMPTAGVRIMAMTDGVGPTSYAPAGLTTVSGKTDAFGNISVTVEIDFLSGASITGVDTTSGADDTVTFRGVP